MNKLLLSCLLLGAFAVIVCGAPLAASAADEQQPAAAPTADDGKAVFEKQCTSCHKAVRVEKYNGSAPWKTVVSRMIKKNGAKIDENTAAQVVTYLDKTYPKK